MQRCMSCFHIELFALLLCRASSYTSCFHSELGWHPYPAGVGRFQTSTRANAWGYVGVAEPTSLFPSSSSWGCPGVFVLANVLAPFANPTFAFEQG